MMQFFIDSVIVLIFLEPCQPIKLSAAGTTLSSDQSEAQLLGPFGTFLMALQSYSSFYGPIQ